ncbi:hypothetical protein [Kineosporia succinea]|uniref:Peptidase inhibitor family I36 n=1 Tax=Kineosporia succinea TaxID=84632 RepID=A0ABT9P5A9_9ACTN|nr:hypothetical protein [Kineosporia succinea]MDP9827869.1 hypothetical protein [Kineosporia succinea]
MLNRFRSLSLVAASALALTGLGIGTAGSAQAVTWDCGTEVHATWGGGQLCVSTAGEQWKVRTRDESTDGYCVHAKYYSEDHGSYQTIANTTECDGVWKTRVIGNTLPWRDGVRLYRGDGRYLTLPR